MLDGRGQVNMLTQTISALVKTGIVFGIIIALLIYAQKIRFLGRMEKAYK